MRITKAYICLVGAVVEAGSLTRNGEGGAKWETISAGNFLKGSHVSLDAW